MKNYPHKNKTHSLTALALAGIVGAAGLAFSVTLPSPATAAPITSNAVQNDITVTQKKTTDHGWTATITWTAATSPSSWLVGRDGTDTSGYGAWSDTVSGTLRSWTFNALRPGDTYRLYAKGSDGQSREITIVVGATVSDNITIKVTQAKDTPSLALVKRAIKTGATYGYSCAN